MPGSKTKRPTHPEKPIAGTRVFQRIDRPSLYCRIQLPYGGMVVRSCFTRDQDQATAIAGLWQAHFLSVGTLIPLSRHHINRAPQIPQLPLL